MSVRGPPTPMASSSVAPKAASPPPLTADPRGAPTSAGSTAPSSGDEIPRSPPSAGAVPLISLERPFDIDEFSQMLGETTIQVEVPREDLAEALRRISDFMGFGIYVYSFRVRPGRRSCSSDL